MEFSKLVELVVQHDENVIPVLRKNVKLVIEGRTEKPMRGSLLHVAASCGNRDVAKLLIDEFEMDVNEADGILETPLHLACLNHCAPVVKLLLENKASVDKKNGQNTTPLFYASHVGALSCIRLLLEFGANRSVRNKQGKSSIDVAANDEVKKILGTADEAVHNRHAEPTSLPSQQTSSTTPSSMSPLAMLVDQELSRLNQQLRQLETTQQRQRLLMRKFLTEQKRENPNQSINSVTLVQLLSLMNFPQEDIDALLTKGGKREE